MNVFRAETEAARAACFAIRRAVFIEEQEIPEAEEWDDHDAACIHYLAEDGTGPVGTARLIAEGRRARIGRVAIMPGRRGAGLGRRLVEAVLKDARGAGFETAVLAAQGHAVAFYARFGFAAEGPEYDDGSGIAHRAMRLPLG